MNILDRARPEFQERTPKSEAIEFGVRPWNLRFAGQWAEVRRRPPVPRRCFVGRGDSQEHRFIERTRDEVDANRERRWYRSDEVCAGVRVTLAIPDLRGEAGRNRNRRKTLLSDQRLANRRTTIDGWFAGRGQFSWWYRRHWRHERIEPLFLHALEQKVLKSEPCLKAPASVQHIAALGLFAGLFAIGKVRVVIKLRL